MSGKRIKYKQPLMYRILRVVAWIVMPLFFPTRYEGRENIPQDQGYILCSNHRSAMDPIYLGHMVPQQLRFMAKSELFKGKFASWFLRVMGAFPVVRGGGDTHALDEAEQIIRDGGVMAIFPEGKRSRDGSPLPFRSGIAVVAAQTGADILPVSISCKGRVRAWKRVTIRYGKLIPQSELGLTPESPRGQLKAAVRLLNQRVNDLTTFYPEAYEPKAAPAPKPEPEIADSAEKRAE